MNVSPDPANEMARKAAGDVRQLILAHVHATDIGVDAVFTSGLESVVGRAFEGAMRRPSRWER
jgi:hypothetical protein